MIKNDILKYMAQIILVKCGDRTERGQKKSVLHLAADLVLVDARSVSVDCMACGKCVAA